jgi:hypothetical protein
MRTEPPGLLGAAPLHGEHKWHAWLRVLRSRPCFAAQRYIESARGSTARKRRDRAVAPAQGDAGVRSA